MSADALYKIVVDYHEKHQSLVKRTQDTDSELEQAHAYIDQTEAVFQRAGTILNEQLSTLREYRQAADNLEDAAAGAREAIKSLSDLCDRIDNSVEKDRPASTRREQRMADALDLEDDTEEQYQDAIGEDASSHVESEALDDDVPMNIGAQVPLPEGDSEFSSPPSQAQPSQQLAADEKEDDGADTFGEEGDDDLNIN